MHPPKSKDDVNVFIAATLEYLIIKEHNKSLTRRLVVLQGWRRSTQSPAGEIKAETELKVSVRLTFFNPDVS